MSKDLLVIYRNYLFALQTIEEYGNKYGDEDVIKIYEEKYKDGYKYVKENNK